MLLLLHQRLQVRKMAVRLSTQAIKMMGMLGKVRVEREAILDIGNRDFRVTDGGERDLPGLYVYPELARAVLLKHGSYPRQCLFFSCTFVEVDRAFGCDYGIFEIPLVTLVSM